MNTIIIHYSVLIIYGAVFYFCNIRFPPSYNTQFHFGIVEMISFMWYLCSILPYLMLLGLYHFCGRRLNHLFQKPDKKSTIYVSECNDPTHEDTQDNSNDQNPQTEDNVDKKEFRQILCIDPMSPKESYMNMCPGCVKKIFT